MGIVKFDGKNWLARTEPGKEPNIISPPGIDKFDFVTENIRSGLGSGGIVAIINARGENDPYGSDFRYEWLLDQGKEKIKEFKDYTTFYKDYSAFYVPEKEIFVVKGQEVHVRDTKTDNPIAAFLFYGLPYYRNINSKDPEGAIIEAKSLQSIIGLSRIIDKKRFSDIYKDLLEKFLDFVVIGNGTDKVFGDPRKLEKDLYDALFNKVGAIAVTGAYDIAKKGKTFVGKYYTEFPEAHSAVTGSYDIAGKGKTFYGKYFYTEYPVAQNFFEYFHKNLRASAPSDTHVSKLVNLSMQTEKFAHGLRMVKDKYLRKKHTIKYD
jgi:hypothetical protein